MSYARAYWRKVTRRKTKGDVTWLPHAFYACFILETMWTVHALRACARQTQVADRLRAIMRSNPRRARPNSCKKVLQFVADYDEVEFVCERLVGINDAQAAGWIMLHFPFLA